MKARPEPTPEQQQFFNAVQYGNQTTFQELLNTVNTHFEIGGMSPLAQATVNNNLMMVQALVSLGQTQEERELALEALFLHIEGNAGIIPSQFDAVRNMLAPPVTTAEALPSYHMPGNVACVFESQ